MGRLVLRHITNSIVKPSLTWLAGLVLFVPSTFAQSADKPLVQMYSLADIGTDAPSWVTLQGPDGIIYSGADSLLSFNGLQWHQWPANGAYGLRGLAFGKNGKLWAGASNEIGWYAHESNGDWTYHSLVSKLPAEHARLGENWSTFSEGDGALFVNAEKLLRWNGEKFSAWSFPGGRHLQGIRSGDDIYLHHAPTGLYLVDPQGPRLVIPVSVLGKAMMFWVEKDAQGLRLVNSQGFFRYRNDELVPYAPEASAFVRVNRLTSAVKLPDGRLALGTYRGGIGLVDADGTMERVLDEKDGLPPHAVFSLFVDREDGLWVNSDSSIFRLSLGAASTLFKASPSSEHQPITKIVRQKERLLVATWNGISSLDEATGKMTPMEFPFASVMDLQPADRGLLIAASGGLKLISDDKMTEVLSVPQTANVVQSSRIWPGRVMVSDLNSIFLVDADGQSRILVHDLPDLVSSIAEDSQGRLWLGTTTRGVLLATPNALTPVNALPVGKAFGLPHSAGPGRVRAGTDGRVFAVLDSSGWMLSPHASRFVAIENYPAWSTKTLSEVAADGSLWVLHQETKDRAATAARISLQGDRAKWEPHSVDGLWQVGTPECILSETGTKGKTTLWIGGTTGLIRHSVAAGPLAPIPSSPSLRSLARSADDDALHPIARALPYSTRAIVFEFATPVFDRRPALHLETKLEGVDQQWVPAHESSRREFTALRDGNYTFSVRTVAETGVSSPPTFSRFEIAPPWWRTTTALLGALLALLPTGYGVYRWRVRLLRQRNLELEQKVLERTEQLEKASAAKTQFVANMSHDIRNPLNGIVGLSLALEDTWLDVKQREIVATLRECTTYLSTLVDDVLDFASIEAGQVELRPAPFSPAELLRSIAAMFKMEAIASGAVIEVEADAQLPRAYVGDAGRIQQVLVNFVSNALKYSGGPIKLTVTIPADAPEEIEFSVTDQGPGISEEGQRLLFNKFSRLTASQSKEITGSGLGLASCRLLAGMMSGSVGVQSSLGHGARFHLRLPLDIFPIPPTDSPAPPMAVPILPNCSVLLVEDTNYNAMAAAAVLAKFGLSCERANSGAEALKLFTEKRHNLVLLDRNLPDMDGTEVARRIRALEADGPRTIILAVTAYCTLEDRALCLNAGMDAFVGKPLTPQKLRRVLTAAGRRHLAAASMHVSPEVSSTSVDVSLLEYISDGTNQGLSRQIELFLTALGEAEKQLQQAARTADFKLLAEAAHGVLSHARLVGSASLSTAAASLQTAANANEREAFGPLLTRVRREIESLTAVVRRHPGAERPA